MLKHIRHTVAVVVGPVDLRGRDQIRLVAVVVPVLGIVVGPGVHALAGVDPVAHTSELSQWMVPMPKSLCQKLRLRVTSVMR